jgi:hypothetical protein
VTRVVGVFVRFFVRRFSRVYTGIMDRYIFVDRCSHLRMVPRTIVEE